MIKGLDDKTYYKKYYQENKERLCNLRKKRYENNKELEISKSVEYHKNNPEVNKKACIKYRKSHKKEINSRCKDWRNRNRDKAIELSREWAINNPNYGKEWAKKNRAILNSRDSKRRAIEKRAFPKWANIAEINRIYEIAEFMSIYTGIKHHVYHIYPLNGVKCSGFHVENNLRVITAENNLKKGNKMPTECGYYD